MSELSTHVLADAQPTVDLAEFGSRLAKATGGLRVKAVSWHDADGRVLAELPVVVGRQQACRILRVDLPLGPGRELPMAWLRAAAGPLAALGALFVLLHGCWRWAKLRAARTASRAAAARPDRRRRGCRGEHRWRPDRCASGRYAAACRHRRPVRSDVSQR